MVALLQSYVMQADVRIAEQKNIFFLRLQSIDIRI
jgi:hypothetical protein